ncbi:GGDEF domain-containing protein [Paractinoplanes durhamensis]|nr:GGDEF domain-containing protein [Actinoplanes durhamensis]
MIAAALWALAGVGLLFTFDDHHNSQVRVFWLFQPPLDLLLAYSSWRVARKATGALRRFWRVLAAAGTLFTIGDTSQVVLAFHQQGQWSTAGGTVQGACFAVGMGAVIVGMLMHPFPGRSGREKLAFWLDSTTVLVGGAVVAWCFAVGQNGTDDLVGTLVAGAVILTSGFAAVKLVLSGNAPMHRAAAIPMILAAGVNSIGFFLPSGSDGHLPAYVYAARFFPSLLIAMGPRIQEIVVRFDETTAFGSRRRRPYSLLPYGSIAVAFTAVLAALPSDTNTKLLGAISGLGLIFALVVLRQLAAFHDNTRLIDQLDATLAELRQQEDRLRHQALFDGLTGLANRTHFHEEVTAALATCEPGTTSLLLIDLDGFKAVNDTLGHEGGDALLAGVADKLRDSVRTGDMVARLGGDEFAILLRDCDDHDAELTSKRILEALGDPIPYADTLVRANASIGFACAEPGDEVSGLLRAADLAMYAAKHDGKGTWMRYHESMQPTGR